MSTYGQFCVFISAVSGDYRDERTKVREVLESSRGGESYKVFEQTQFDNSGVDSLLQQIQSYVMTADVVVSLVGPQAGFTPPGRAAEYFRIFRPEQFDRPSYTQWEIFFARTYHKPILHLVPQGLFESRLQDPSQQKFVRELIDSNVLYETFTDRAQIPALARKWVDARRAASKLLKGILDGPVATHVQAMRNYSLGRLTQFAGEPLTHLSDVYVQFANRVAQRSHDELLHLPIAIKASAVARVQNPHWRFENLLLVAGAGDGKTTLVHTLLCEFAQEVRIEFFQLVPMLADCVTLGRLLGPTPDEDSDVVARWLELAVAPWGHQAGGRSTVSPRDFLNQVKKLGYKLLIIIDGLDELDPSGVSTEPMDRWFRALREWERAEGLSLLFLATCRPRGGPLEHDDRVLAAKAWGLQPVELLPVERAEISVLANHLLASKGRGRHRKTLERFVDIFQGPSIESRLFYLRPLVRFFRKYPRAIRHGAISNLLLMREEVAHIVGCIEEQLAERNHGPVAARATLAAQLRHVLLEIAMGSLHPFDRELPSHLSKNALASFRSVREVKALTTLIADTRGVVERLLHVLVYVTRQVSPTGELLDVFYRLPHNEMRDYLLAEGLFGWIRGESCLIDRRDADFLGDLACSYARAERVKVFLRQITQEQWPELGCRERMDFAYALAERMNGPLATRAPIKRTDASPHGAMLSLLLDLGPLPSDLEIAARGRSFQGASVPKLGPGERRVLHLEEDCAGASFAEADLRGADLAGLDLCGANLDNAALNGASAQHADFSGANLRNISMGEYNGLPTDLSDATFAGSDWFNYRFHGLRGYFHFWDLECVLGERFVLAAGSRGQLLLFDLEAKRLAPVIIQTGHCDEIVDLSRHPARDVIVTTSRDGTVRLSSFPAGEPSSWPKEDGTGHVLLPEIGFCDALFDTRNYPRRALFSASGRWLAVVARDPRVAMLPVDADLRLGKPIYGYGHAGPVMCVVADSEQLTNAGNQRLRDVFLTAGYDGRLAFWREDPAQAHGGWTQPERTLEEPLRHAGQVEILRSLAAGAGRRGFWAGTELGCQLQHFKASPRELRQVAPPRTFEAGVFALAVCESPSLLAVGLASGCVKVFRAGRKANEYDWDHPVLEASTNAEIVRSLNFIRGGRELLVATWDACLFRFDLATGAELGRFEYPEDCWLPAVDAGQIRFDTARDPLRTVGGISDRMKAYLRLVNEHRLAAP